MKRILPCLILCFCLYAAGTGGEELKQLMAPYVPTPHDVVAAMLGLAKVASSDTVYDLGCGDGRIVIAAARDFGAHGVGVEIDPKLVSQCRANAEAAGVPTTARFINGDLFETDLAPATVVTLYLYEQLNLRLRPRLLTVLRPGTRIVAHDFGMGSWTPDSTATLGTHRMFFWKIPENISGEWDLAAGPGASGMTYHIAAAQKFQKVTATVDGGGMAQVSMVVVDGENVGFTILRRQDGTMVPWHYSGIANDGAMSGTARPDGGNGPAVRWHAERAPGTMKSLD